MALELISIHIGKTAGTAFRHVLSQVYGEDNVLWDYAPYSYQPPAPLSLNTQAIHGHVSISKYQDFFPEAKRIVWLRHPIARLISEYFFAQMYKDPHNPLHVELVEKKLGLLEFASQPDAQNIQANQIFGLDLCDFYFFGIQEFYGEDVEELKTLMGWQDLKLSIENRNDYPGYHHNVQRILENRSLLEKLMELNQHDLELYEMALSLRAKRRQESKSIQIMLSNLYQSQPYIEDLQEQLAQLKFWQQSVKSQIRSGRLIQFQSCPKVDEQVIFFIDQPSELFEIKDETILIQGWVLGKISKVNCIHVTCQERVLVEVFANQHRPDVKKKHDLPGAEQSGFSIKLFTAGMPPNTELQVQAVLDNQITVSLCQVNLLEDYHPSNTAIPQVKHSMHPADSLLIC
jgi:hypothetical protein